MRPDLTRSYRTPFACGAQWKSVRRFFVKLSLFANEPVSATPKRNGGMAQAGVIEIHPSGSNAMDVFALLGFIERKAFGEVNFLSARR